ncbi:MAG: NBR1-Ig-like domain-containing protein, partial [Chloroflexota bacterium]|nr:NBR1-Ig-like domain-containing protein [Chloroflexota bacterium]
GEDTLLVAPYQNYYHLLREGNRRHPVVGEPGYDWYRDVIMANSGTEYPPLIKLETYGVGERPHSNPSLALPNVNDNGQIRPVRAGDHIRVTGLYVIDYAHQMFSDLYTDSFCYMRGFYRACYAHAELHPYNPDSVELLTSSPPATVSAETHTVVAPVYPEVYSFTYAWNKVSGVAGHFVDAAKQEQQTAAFFIGAPVRPGPDYELRFRQSDVTKVGQGEATVSHSPVADKGVSVQVVVTGSNVLNPLVYQARYSVDWVPKIRSDAAFVSQNVPATMVAGRKYKVSVMMRNSGTKTWTPAGQYHALGSQSPQDNQLWGLNRFKVPTSVPPGGEITFAFEVTAPSTPGTYDLQWRMVHEWVEWFGDYTPKTKVSVTPPQLSTRIEPYPVILRQSRQYIVRAEDAGTHALVAGTVKIINPGAVAKQFPVNTPFSFTFRAGLTSSGEELVMPRATVSAPGYATAELDLGVEG